MTPDEVQKRKRAHIIAFAAVLALMFMAAATVLGGKANPPAVLGIAAVQVGIVLAAMMHAHREGPWVRWVIVFCVVNIAGLAGILLLGYYRPIVGTEHVVIAAPGSESGEAEH